jgi:hypothetical protein
MKNASRTNAVHVIALVTLLVGPTACGKPEGTFEGLGPQDGANIDVTPVGPSNATNSPGIPQRASGVQDARAAICLGTSMEVRLSFPQSSLRLGEDGSIEGDIGSVSAYHGKVGEPLTRIDSSSVYMLTQGSQTTIGVWGDGDGTRLELVTVDFRTGSAKGKVGANTLPASLNCIFYLGR